MTDVTCGHAIAMDPDEAFEAISNRRRRRVILSLARTDGPISASDLAAEIAAIENVVDPSEVTGEQRTRVYVSLVQSHLETLDELDVAEYDERSKRVVATDATEPLADFIQQVTTACYKPEDGQ